MPLPILPILTALSPFVAKMVHDLIRESDRERGTGASQQWLEALELVEGRLAEIQERWLIAERKLAVAEDRLAEAQKKRGWWPWSKQL